MKKIMFNDRFLLTDSVLNGSKTQTRRIVKIPSTFNGVEVFGFRKMTNSLGEWYTELYDEDERTIDCSYLKPQYQVGEVVAVAQSYKDCGEFDVYEAPKGTAGWNNKMFVKAELMPHQIRITGVRIERLQDISEEDCLKEGVWLEKWADDDKAFFICENDKELQYDTPREAYAALIDKVSGKGTWDSNPFVWVYDFELIK